MTAPKTARQRGTHLGLAIGDALGAAVEFEMPGCFDIGSTTIAALHRFQQSGSLLGGWGLT